MYAWRSISRTNETKINFEYWKTHRYSWYRDVMWYSMEWPKSKRRIMGRKWTWCQFYLQRWRSWKLLQQKRNRPRLPRPLGRRWWLRILRRSKANNYIQCTQLLWYVREWWLPDESSGGPDMLIFNIEAVKNSRIQNLPPRFRGIGSSSGLLTI